MNFLADPSGNRSRTIELTSEEIGRLGKAKIIFGFPTIGKSTLAREDDTFRDVDEGNLRAALGGLPRDHPISVEAMKKAMKYWVNEGKVPITNSVGLITYANKMGWKPVVVLPAYSSDVAVNRILKRDNKGKEFAVQLRNNWDEWIHDAEILAERYSAPLYTVMTLSELLKDHKYSTPDGAEVSKR